MGVEIAYGAPLLLSYLIIIKILLFAEKNDILQASFYKIVLISSIMVSRAFMEKLPQTWTNQEKKTKDNRHRIFLK